MSRAATFVWTFLACSVAVPAAAQSAAPCATCVAVSLDEAAARDLLGRGLRLAGVDLVLEAAAVPADVVSDLHAAGARVWLVVGDADADPRGLARAAGAFVQIDPRIPADRAAFEAKRRATDLRAVRPDLRVGLVATPAVATPQVLEELAAYLDALWIPAGSTLAPDAVRRRVPGVTVWVERGAADVFDAARGLASDTAVIDGRGRVQVVPALVALRPWLPPGLTPLPDVQVTCEGCEVETWMHPETLEAIAIVRGAPAGPVMVAPAATRVARADLGGGGEPVPLTVEAAAGAVRVLGDLQDGPAVLRISGWRGVEDEVYRSEVQVTAARSLSVAEVLARHQAHRARQERLVEHVISTGSTVLTFEVPGFAGPVAVTAETTIFTRGALTEVAQRNIRVNGVDMSLDGRAPRLPIIEPERVSTPPLTITLNAAYTYRLDGREREGGRDCYVVAFTPADSAADGTSFIGRAWIDAASFAMVRMEARQTGLRGPVVSSEQHDAFAPVRLGDREVWLPVRSASFQVYQAAGLRTPIHREILTPRHEVNAPGFDAALAAAHGSPAVMLRDTPEGYRYLVPEKPRPGVEVTRRVVAPSAGERVLTLAFGVIVDPNISVPLPFAGLSYLDFDFLGKGAQFSGFFGGTYGQAAWSVPGFLRPGWQLTGRAFGIGVSYNDRSFRNGREQYRENILQRPFRADVEVVAPVSPRVQVRLGYDFEYNAFAANDDTGPGFIVPADEVAHGARVALDVQRGPWSALAWWNPARRQGWRPWGRPGDYVPGTGDYVPGTEDFQRYGVTVARSWVLSPTSVARLEGSYMDGHDLDRFSRFTFDSFENRLRGYPSASLRYDRGFVARSVATWTPTARLRLDGFADYAAVRDPGFGTSLRSYPGFGAAVELAFPGRLLLAVEWGYGVEALNTDGTRGTHVVKISGFRIF